MSRAGESASDPLRSLARTIEVLTGSPATREVMSRFERYLELLIQWNRAQRLTGFRSRADMVHGLLEDSLLFLSVLPPRPLRLVDIGAGAGIPGLPLRIVDSRIALTLIEAKRKRVSFLRAVVRELELEGDVKVIEGRAESVASMIAAEAGPFDVAVARSVGSIQTLRPLAERYLVPRGRLILSGGPARSEGSLRPDPVQNELSSGGPNWEVVEFPDLKLRRAFVSIEMCG